MHDWGETAMDIRYIAGVKGLYGVDTQDDMT